MTDNVVDAEIQDLKAKAAKHMPKYAELSFKTFLEEVPPDQYVDVVDLKLVPGTQSQQFKTPDLSLFCASDKCDGLRLFRCAQNLYPSSEWAYKFLDYTCKNCTARIYRFAISYHVTIYPSSTVSGRATCLKLGQIPAFGPNTPTRLISLIGPDREIFLQGRRAENRGLGIGAFAYYRRVVENQKNRIIAEVARVAKILGCSIETEKTFADAIKETRFKESIDMVRDVMPQSLMISGHNPLTLLHSALSKGLHDSDMTDDRCLELARSIRTILAELSEKASEALKDDKEIQNALSVLIAVRGKSD